MKPYASSLSFRTSLMLICLMTMGVLLTVLRPAQAASPAAPIKLTLQVQKEQRQAAADGTTTVTLVPVAKVIPGDRLVYVLSYINTGTQPISDVVLDYPLPAGVAYRAAAEGSLAPLVSIDGSHFAPTAEGARPIKALRWQVPGALAPGAHGQISFKATLD
jgi:uncharacterized repeat protein (TIGR01451 family)